MILLDTHAWIWLTSDKSQLGAEAARTIEAASSIAVSAISCWEVANLVAKNRIALDREPVVWIHKSLDKHQILVLPLTPEIAVGATQLGRDGPRDPADRIIAATAREFSALLVTRDAELAQSNWCRTVW